VHLVTVYIQLKLQMLSIQLAASIRDKKISKLPDENKTAAIARRPRLKTFCWHRV